MPPTNILVMVHGMTTVREAATHQADYDALWNGLVEQTPALNGAFAKVVRVEWGHRPPGVPPGDLRDDQRLTDAEKTLHDRVSYASVKGDHSFWRGRAQADPQTLTLGSKASTAGQLP